TSNTSTAWTIGKTSETERSVLIDISEKKARAPIYNRATVVGVNASNTAQYRGVATDTDPTSLTQYGGPFGKKPMPPVTSSLIGSQAQAVAASQALLTSQLGSGQSLIVDAVPNEALEAGDPVQIVRTEMGIDQVHLADVIRLGLGPGGVQRIETRRAA
ncbi:MAG TPA: hypothetical protein PLV68_16150, partial [Ilumatobacteraceae bacterium]|nr:hypothetical protein [Ilumatobacteraceae bacterium]